MKSLRDAVAVAEGATKDGSVVASRVAFLVGKRCRVRLWWTQEAQVSSPGGDLFEAVLADVVPIGRDYYFVFATNDEDGVVRRSLIKTAAVLQVMEIA